MDLSFAIPAGPRQRSHSRVRVPRDSWPYFTASYSRLSESWGPGPHIYIPQEHNGPVLPPGTWFPFRRLLRLAMGEVCGAAFAWAFYGSSPRYITPVRTAQKSHFLYYVFSRCQGNNVSTELFHSNGCFTITRLHNCYLAMGIHDTIFNTLRSTHPPIQWVPGSLSVKVAGAWNEPLTSIQCRGLEFWRYNSTPYAFITRCLIT
jgi:hypothetical protein